MAKLKKQDIPFTQIANEVLNDKKISLKAKGLYSYLFSKPASWQFSGHRIINDHTDGRDSVYSAIKELEDGGYLERCKLPNRRMEYKLLFSIDTEKPYVSDTEIPKYGNSNIGKIRTVSNKEEESNKEKKVINPTAGGGKEINEIIFLFKAVNPMIQRLYGSPPQRKSVERMMKEFGREKLESMIQALPKINGQKYWPKSTTPVQLENNIAVYLAKKSELETKQADSKIKVAIIA